jgi:hypothetical protein
MGIQASDKHGVQSTSRKAASSRHGIAPQPRTRPVTGAFGREGSGRRTPRSAGPLRRRATVAGSRRTRTRGPVGISNLPLELERREQTRVPPRGQRRLFPGGPKKGR